MAQFTVPEVELKDVLLSNNSFGPSEITFVSNRISNDYTQFPVLKEVAQELEAQPDRTPATSVRLGICQYLLGPYHDAIATLENADGGELAHFYQGKAHYALTNYHRAIAAYQSAKTAGYDRQRTWRTISYRC